MASSLSSVHEHVSQPTDTRLFWYSVSGILIALSVVARIFSYPVVTSDYSGFLVNWYTAVETNGLHAFAQPFADYAPLYLYLLKIASWIPVSSLYSIKSISVLADIVIAFMAYRLVHDLPPKRMPPGYAVFAAAITFAVPTFIINSSLWGQSDAVYAAGVIASFYFLLIRRPLLATAAFGIAISLKLQAIFFLPILVGMLMREGKTLWTLIAVPVLFFLSLVPALLGGGSLSYWGGIYLTQSGEYPWLSVSAPSIFAYVTSLPLGSWSGVLFYLGLAAAGIASLVVMWLIARRQTITTAWLISISFWCVLALPYLLPRMHERYFYLADLFSVLYGLYFPQRWYIPAIMIAASCMSYTPFLSGQVALLKPFYVPLELPATLLVFILCTTAIWLYRETRHRVLLRDVLAP